MDYFDNFTVTPTGYCYSPKHKTQISCGWEYELPVTGLSMLSRGQTQP